jgi:hypothetical protein
MGSSAILAFGIGSMQRRVAGEDAGTVRGMEMKTLDELKTRLLEVDDLNAAASVLRWDQMTY